MLTVAQLFIGVGLIALQVLALWLTIEAAWWLFAKVTGRKY